jgi:hypothetical protein
VHLLQSNAREAELCERYFCASGLRYVSSTLGLLEPAATLHKSSVA